MLFRSRSATCFLASAVTLLSMAPPARADTRTQAALGVARVSAASGDVSVRRGDSGDWVVADVNLPLVEGDSVRTLDASRAEVQLDLGNVVRMTGNAEVQFVELGEKRFRVRVISGTALYSEWQDSAADIDIETPKAAVRPSAKGRYRVFVADDWTLVEVREGLAEIAFEQNTTSLAKGEALTIWTVDERTEFETAKIGSQDAFDRWSSKRDRELRRTVRSKYLSRDIYGVETLASHGRWRMVRSVGWCWFPRVSISWAPYRYGRWVWVGYYGWTWVPDEPWGWAPSHWGRWHYDVALGWGWYPGRRGFRHVWQPALVSFAWGGYGHVGPSYVTWSPLGLHDAYQPWYGRGRHGSGAPGSAQSTNVVVNVNNSADTRFDQVARQPRQRLPALAGSYLRADEFGSGKAVTPRSLRLGMQARSTPVRGPLPIVPSRQSQGRVLPASSTSVRAARSGDWGRVQVSRLRDGSPRSTFEQQRARLQRTAEDFGRLRAGAVSSGAPPASVGRGISNVRSSAARVPVATGDAPERSAPSVGRPTSVSSSARSGAGIGAKPPPSSLPRGVGIRTGPDAATTPRVAGRPAAPVAAREELGADGQAPLATDQPAVTPRSLRLAGQAQSGSRQGSVPGSAARSRSRITTPTLPARPAGTSSSRTVAPAVPVAARNDTGQSGRPRQTSGTTRVVRPASLPDSGSGDQQPYADRGYSRVGIRSPSTAREKRPSATARGAGTGLPDRRGSSQARSVDRREVRRATAATRRPDSAAPAQRQGSRSSTVRPAAGPSARPSRPSTGSVFAPRQSSRVGAEARTAPAARRPTVSSKPSSETGRYGGAGSTASRSSRAPRASGTPGWGRETSRTSSVYGARRSSSSRTRSPSTGSGRTPTPTTRSAPASSRSIGATRSGSAGSRTVGRSGSAIGSSRRVGPSSQSSRAGRPGNSVGSRSGTFGNPAGRSRSGSPYGAGRSAPGRPSGTIGPRNSSAGRPVSSSRPSAGLGSRAGSSRPAYSTMSRSGPRGSSGAGTAGRPVSGPRSSGSASAGSRSSSQRGR